MSILDFAGNPECWKDGKVPDIFRRHKTLIVSGSVQEVNLTLDNIIKEYGGSTSVKEFVRLFCNKYGLDDYCLILS